VGAAIKLHDGLRTVVGLPDPDAPLVVGPRDVTEAQNGLLEHFELVAIPIGHDLELDRLGLLPGVAQELRFLPIFGLFVVWRRGQSNAHRQWGQRDAQSDHSVDPEPEKIDEALSLNSPEFRGRSKHLNSGKFSYRVPRLVSIPRSRYHTRHCRLTLRPRRSLR